MLNKKLDIRVEILSYVNDNGVVEYFPRCGFPLEVFVVSENTKINIYTKENFNTSTFIFHNQPSYTRDITVSLKKMLFLGSYLLYDQSSWESNFSTANTLANVYDSITVSNLFLSPISDLKVIQLHIISKKKKWFDSISNIFSNATWLERENSEMFNVYYKRLKDSRKLLLDYTTKKGVMLKLNDAVNNSSYYKNHYSVNFN